MSAPANQALAQEATFQNCETPSRSVRNPLGVSGVNNRLVDTGVALEHSANVLLGDTFSRIPSLKVITYVLFIRNAMFRALAGFRAPVMAVKSWLSGSPFFYV